MTVVAILGTVIPCAAANFSENSTVQSKNTIKFQSNEGMVEMYGSDIKMLTDKVSTISLTAFDPSCYTHVHSWQYSDINESDHTKHCAACGSDYDITTGHRETIKEAYEISYKDIVYSANKYVCECGYQWILETSHNFVYHYIDEDTHRIECALDGTDYCPGFESSLYEHTADEIVPCDDNEHHTYLCICGYEREEECDYTTYTEENEEAGETIKCCLCGNFIVESDEQDAAEQDEVDMNDETEDMKETSNFVLLQWNGKNRTD
jgi:hypothetical protein